MRTDHDGLQLDCGVVLTEDDLNRLANELFRRLLSSPEHHQQLMEAVQTDQLFRTFPDFPVDKGNACDISFRVQWYKEQGFSPRARSYLAEYYINPLLLLTAKVDGLTKLHIGRDIWKEVQDWQEKNKDKIPT